MALNRFDRRIGLAAAVVALVLAGAARAAATDPAAIRIEALDRALLETMKAGPALGPKGRYARLAPAVDSAFDLPVMTSYAVGPTWRTLPAAEQKALVKAFTRLSVASYAHNFASFSGERFEVDPAVQTRGVDKIVQAHILPAHGAPTALSYRMRQTADGWKIIDVYYGAISQLTNRRSDFAGPLAAGGAKGLTSHLDALTDKLLK